MSVTIAKPHCDHCISNNRSVLFRWFYCLLTPLLQYYSNEASASSSCFIPTTSVAKRCFRRLTLKTKRSASTSRFEPRPPRVLKLQSIHLAKALSLIIITITCVQRTASEKRLARVLEVKTLVPFVWRLISQMSLKTFSIACHFWRHFGLAEVSWLLSIYISLRKCNFRAVTFFHFIAGRLRQQLDFIMDALFDPVRSNAPALFSLPLSAR